MAEAKTGRKRLPDSEKKSPVAAWLRGDQIKALGGIAAARKKALEYLTAEALKPTKSK